MGGPAVLCPQMLSLEGNLYIEFPPMVIVEKGKNVVMQYLRAPDREREQMEATAMGREDVGLNRRTSGTYVDDAAAEAEQSALLEEGVSRLFILMVHLHE